MLATLTEICRTFDDLYDRGRLVRTPGYVRNTKFLLGPGDFRGRIYVNPEDIYFVEQEDRSFSALRGYAVLREIRERQLVGGWYESFDAEIFIPDHPLHKIWIHPIRNVDTRSGSR